MSNNNPMCSLCMTHRLKHVNCFAWTCWTCCHTTLGSSWSGWGYCVYTLRIARTKPSLDQNHSKPILYTYCIWIICHVHFRTCHNAILIYIYCIVPNAVISIIYIYFFIYVFMYKYIKYYIHIIPEIHSFVNLSKSQSSDTSDMRSICAKLLLLSLPVLFDLARGAWRVAMENKSNVLLQKHI